VPLLKQVSKKSILYLDFTSNEINIPSYRIMNRIGETTDVLVVFVSGNSNSVLNDPACKFSVKLIRFPINQN